MRRVGRPVRPAASADDRAGVEVHGMLGLVRHVRAPIFQLRDAGIGIMRMPPLLVGALLSARPIQPRPERQRVAALHATPRSESMSSKYPISSRRKSIRGAAADFQHGLLN